MMSTPEERRAEREMVMQLKDAKLQHKLDMEALRVVPVDTMRANLSAFAAERAKLMGYKPVPPGERMPLPFSGVGGDIPENTE